VSKDVRSRRNFLKLTVTAAGATFFSPSSSLSQTALATQFPEQRPETGPADYMLRTASSPVEIAAKRIVATITYNGQFPGPLLRFKEGQTATVEVHNDTDAPEQLHWHGQMVSTEVDGAAEEGTPFIPARGMRRIVFTPRPSGLRFYHTHNRAGADLHAWSVQRPGRTCIYRTQARARELRPGNLSRSQRIRTVIQSRR
jgi:FtsP/CotA-like multicopper oxidase with cupredoxin domain